MSVSYLCAKWSPPQTLCAASFDVWYARRARFDQFHEPGEPQYDCDVCKDDHYGYRQVCATCCTKLADAAEKQVLKDQRVAADRDEWVRFLRHCAGHGGYKVQY